MSDKPTHAPAPPAPSPVPAAAPQIDYARQTDEYLAAVAEVMKGFKKLYDDQKPGLLPEPIATGIVTAVASDELRKLGPSPGADDMEKRFHRAGVDAITDNLPHMREQLAEAQKKFGRTLPDKVRLSGDKDHEVFQSSAAAIGSLATFVQKMKEPEAAKYPIQALSQEFSSNEAFRRGVEEIDPHLAASLMAHITSEISGEAFEDARGNRAKDKKSLALQRQTADKMIDEGYAQDPPAIRDEAKADLTIILKPRETPRPPSLPHGQGGRS